MRKKLRNFLIDLLLPATLLLVILTVERETGPWTEVVCVWLAMWTWVNQVEIRYLRARHDAFIDALKEVEEQDE